MKTPKRPLAPTPRARKLLTKLQALADRGIDGEREAAKVKLERLLRRFDFSIRDNSEAKLFAGEFYPAPGCSAPVKAFDPAAMAWACQIKWALEHSTGIRCAFHGDTLVAEAKHETAHRLAAICETIYTGFNALWSQYLGAPFANRADLPAFRMGLYDGMMGETRADGQPLPQRTHLDRIAKPRRGTLAAPAGITPHPYVVAARLGQLIRFETPLADIEAELSNLITPQLEDENAR